LKHALDLFELIAEGCLIGGLGKEEANIVAVAKLYGTEFAVDVTLKTEVKLQFVFKNDRSFYARRVCASQLYND